MESIGGREMSKYKIDAMYEFLTRHRGYLYPIGTAYLAEATDLLKNSYFKVLAAVLHRGPVITSEQRYLFERLIAGAKCECSFCDFCSQGLEIKPKDFVNIAEQCRESPLRYRLALDAIILSGLGEQSSSQESVIITLIECLHFRKNESEYLVQLAKSVLTEDHETYQSSEGLHSIVISSCIASAYPGSQLTVSGNGGYGIELIEKRGSVKS